ncbi:anti-sigma factor family protein [Anaerotignum sp.]
MNCEAVRGLLWAYLEQETTAEEAVRIEEHLKNCADCREELELQKEIMDSLQNIPDEELPDGFHASLMQKLQAEAAPNVVPFPVKKKKQPVWKQWGMIAAAVLVVVAAGGMNGMLEMRKNQADAVAEMKVADTAEPMDISEDGVIAAEEKDAAEIQIKADGEKQKKNAPAVGAETAAPAIVDPAIAAYDMSEAAPEVASIGAEEESVQFSVTRSAKPEAAEEMILLVTDQATAIAEIQKAIAEAGGFEEATETEGIFAVIPMENYAGFVKAVEAIGTVEWAAKDATEAGGMYRTVEIQIKNQ